MMRPKRAEARSGLRPAIAMYEPNPGRLTVPGMYSSMGIRYHPPPQARMLLQISSGYTAGRTIWRRYLNPRTPYARDASLMSAGIAFTPAMTPKVGAQAIAVKIIMIEANSWPGVPEGLSKTRRKTTVGNPRRGPDGKMPGGAKRTEKPRASIGEKRR